MLTEKKIQIYLPLELYHRSKEYAEMRGSSVASIVRESLEEYLAARTKEIRWEDDPITKAIGFIDGSGPSDLSSNHDRYLYEED
ncbi:MAG: ribbon-helix-helix protein, CopG family [Nitrospinota bacterium]